MENLKEDIVEFVSRYEKIKKITLRKMNLIDVKKSVYDICWTDAEIETMYSNNPKWALLEQKYYSSKR